MDDEDKSEGEANLSQEEADENMDEVSNTQTPVQSEETLEP